jgi:hypothetical protein
MALAWAEGVTQDLQHLLSKCEALSSNPSTEKNKQKKVALAPMSIFHKYHWKEPVVPHVAVLLPGGAQKTRTDICSKHPSAPNHKFIRCQCHRATESNIQSSDPSIQAF